MAIHTEIGFFGVESTHLAKHHILVLEFWSGAGSTWSFGVEQLYPELEPCQTGPKCIWKAHGGAIRGKKR